VKTCGDKMIRNEVELIEPECRNLGEDFALVGYRIGEDAIEGGDAVCGHEQKVVFEIKDRERQSGL
jgi:hypothetical protein